MKYNQLICENYCQSPHTSPIITTPHIFPLIPHLYFEADYQLVQKRKNSFKNQYLSRSHMYPSDDDTKALTLIK